MVVKSGLTVFIGIFFIFLPPFKSKPCKTKRNLTSIPVPQIRDVKRSLKMYYQYVPLNHPLIEKPRKLQKFEKIPFDLWEAWWSNV